MHVPDLIFECGGDYWYAATPRGFYTIQRDRETGGWYAMAEVLHPTGAMALQREYTVPRATLDGAFLACRLAERDGFDAWAASGDTPNTSADAGRPPRVWQAADWAYRVATCHNCGQTVVPVCHGTEPESCPECEEYISAASYR